MSEWTEAHLAALTRGGKHRVTNESKLRAAVAQYKPSVVVLPPSAAVSTLMPGARHQLTIPGHVYSLKTSRAINPVRLRAGTTAFWMFAYHARGGGRAFAPCRPVLGYSPKQAAYLKEAQAVLELQWAGSAPLSGRVGITLEVYWYRNEPDALGPAETVYDLLEAAGVVGNDRQLVPVGMPAVSRQKVAKPEEEKAVITLWEMNGGETE